MTKAELVAKIAKDANLTQAQAVKALNALLETAASELENNSAFALAGLGTFKVVDRAARSGVNPRTKEVITIPPTRNVKFTCARALKDRVNF
ncbi:MAG: HU family DNA-binding protein [Deltaproteobacteria bacterium]|nr:HU family DNA-binding protein [Deltaproteobacteria bacterium]